VAHLKCTACRSRVWREGAAEEHVADLCPGCGGPLEPVGDLSELVGLRCLRARPRRERADNFDWISKQIREAFARRDAQR
jgi:hypothetical protein